jgi:phage N-6-adenine-methyltransferase
VNAADAEEYTQSLEQVVAGGWRLIHWADEQGIPAALGLTLPKWVERIGGYVRLSIPERREAVAELVEEGLSQREIAEVLGVTHTTVQRDLGKNVPPTGAEPQVAEDEGGANVPPDVAPHVTRNTGNDEWYTPSQYIHAARAVLGDIDLDPASSPVANDTVRAERYYTIDDDGLTRPWAGRVWMNPPYSTGLVDKFVVKMLDAYQAGDVKAAVVLTNNATDTRWWQSLARRSSAICMLAGRIKFRGRDGDAAGAGLQGQTIAYLGDDRNLFAERFGEFGVVL